MKISIVGLGWLGLPLAEFLLGKGYSVVGTKTSKTVVENWTRKNISVFHLDLVPELTCSNMEEVFTADWMIINIPPDAKMPAVEEFYFLQMSNLLSELDSAAVKKVLFISSTGVFNKSQGVVSEDAEPQPETATGRALRSAEILFSGNANFASSILRLGGLVGEDRKPGNFLAGKKDLPGGDRPVNLVHRRDVIGLIEKIIRKDLTGHIFHAVSAEHPVKRYFYTRAAEKNGLEPPQFLAEKRDETGVLVQSDFTRKLTRYEFVYDNPLDML